MQHRSSHLTGATIFRKRWQFAYWRRPRSFWSTIVFHFPLSAIFGAALLLPHIASLHTLPMIPCTFLRITGYPCPFCGFTRSFWAISNGQWSAAAANCPLSFPVFIFVAVMFAWHATAILCNVILRPGPMLKLRTGHRSKIAVMVLVLFILNWLYRLSMSLT